MATAAQIRARLDDLDEAIASGALSIRDADGKTVTYRSLSDMSAIADSLRRQLGEGRPRVVITQHRRPR